ncbi:MAG: hypothetical protein ACEQSB_00020 [Undibacterium sp.]
MRTDRPGYVARKRRDGSAAHYWSPQRAVKGAPDFLDMRRIDDHFTDLQIVELCNEWTAELRKEIGAHVEKPKFNGTIESLIGLYRGDPTSSLHTVKYSTKRQDYEPSLKVLDESVGKRRIDILKASDFRAWYPKWRTKGHRRAYGAIKMLRIILTYGAGELLHGCKQARDILSDLSFELPPSRESFMTFGQARAIVLAAIEEKWFSMAFAEALKFETALRRIDVIGEWVPNEEGGAFRWTGLSAGSISKELILSLKTSKTASPITRDLKALPLVMLALQHYALPGVGAVVVSEQTRKPWRTQDYANIFRTVRATAGVPSGIWSMDSRAGAISETKEATGSTEAAQDLATHTDSRMTKKYIRGGDLKGSTDTAIARIASRASET